MYDIRKAQRDDVAAIWSTRRLAILHQCPGHYSAGQLNAWVGGQPGERFTEMVAASFYVSTFAGEVVGTGMLDLGKAEINAIFVHPVHMGQGVGRGLLQQLETIAIDQGLQSLALQSTLNAVGFYRRLGYEGEVRTLYRSARGFSLPCIAMSKRLATIPRESPAQGLPHTL